MAFIHDLTGTLLDRRYRITGLLGKGGMGHVYAAVHVALEQRVAIKVLHPRYAAEERFRERFIREARSASRIQHRNVVRITDFGETPDGSVYFVMELLEGHDVGEDLRTGGVVPWPRTRHILLQAVGALRAAHAKDIIHRDIKPGNCFLTVDKEEGAVDFVKLLDFGIAKVGSDSHADAQGKGLTGTGEVFGTAAYMAPEQARGSQLDARSDMYSLGIMAYEMLTGRVPFTGVNSIHVITKHLNEVPVPPRAHEPSIPAEVEALVLKMIEKEASRRYESMSGLEHALRSIPESAGPPVRRTRVWGGAGGEPAKPAVASGTLGSTTPSPVGAGVAARPAKATGKTSERTAVVTPRAAAAGAAGAVHKGPVVGASGPPPGAPPRGATVPAIPRDREPLGPPQDAAPEAGAMVAAIPAESDRSVPPPPAVPTPGAIAHVVGGHHDQSAPRGAVAHAVHVGQDRSVPLSVGQPLATRRDGSAPPGAWTSGAASTGPLTRVGDSSAETSPQSLQAGPPPPAITGRMVAVVAGLVILVGAGSAVGTMAFLSSREAVEPAAAPAATDPSELDVPAQGVVLEAKEAPAEKVNSAGAASTDAPVIDTPGRDGGSSSGEDGTTGDEPGSMSTGVGIDAEGDPKVVATPKESDVPSPAPKSPPKRPMHETAECKEIRDDAAAALTAKQWKTLQGLTRKSSCWSNAGKGQRVRWLVMSLYELGRYAECIKAGGSSKDLDVQGMVSVCKKKESAK